MHEEIGVRETRTPPQFHSERSEETQRRGQILLLPLKGQHDR
ncbi:uncharacterized protein METZ01_LOCUS400893, partial [marine metagenome]